MDNQIPIKNLSDVVRFQLSQQLTSIAKNFFEIIEDLESEGYRFSEEKRFRIRKKILDKTNDSRRVLESTIDKFDITFKK